MSDQSTDSRSAPTPRSNLALANIFQRPLEEDPEPWSQSIGAIRELERRRVPGTLVANDSQAASQGVNLGLRFLALRAGRVLGVSFWCHSGDMNGPHIGSLWQPNGIGITHARFPPQDIHPGWNSVRFEDPIVVQSVMGGVTFVASVLTNSYSLTDNFFSGGFTWDAWEFSTQRPWGTVTGTAGGNTPIWIPRIDLPTQGNSLTGNGLFAYGGNVFPSQHYQGRNYYVDVIYELT